jgi:hypothetical protein
LVVVGGFGEELLQELIEGGSLVGCERPEGFGEDAVE